MHKRLPGHLIGNAGVIVALIAWWAACQTMGSALVPDPIVIGKEMLEHGSGTHLMRLED